MSNTSVSVDVRLDGEPEITHVCAFAVVDVRNGEEPRDGIRGYVELGGEVKLVGTSERLWQLSKVIADAAMEMERLDSEARAARATRDHYEAEAESAVTA